MAIFNYTLPSGAKYQLSAPSGTTQAQADDIFYNQVAAGTFVGYKAGDTLTHPKEALNNFGISRNERGTAGVDDQTLLAIVAGLPAVAPLPQSLSTAPIVNPIDIADYILVTNNYVSGPISQGVTPVGTLSEAQTQAVMAQVSSSVNQDYNVITQLYGVGLYGFNAQQLERAGYIKPGYAQMYCPIDPVTQANPDNFVEFMQSPTPWTGLSGVVTVDDILNSQELQNQIQLILMQQSYDAFVANGMIQPPAPAVTTPAASTGILYTSSGSLASVSAVTLNTAAPTSIESKTSSIGIVPPAIVNLGPDAVANYNAGIASLSSGAAIAGSSSTSSSNDSDNLLAGLAIGAIGGGAIAEAIAAANSGDISALIANGSKFGPAVTAAWASGTNALTDLSNVDLSQVADKSLASLQTAATDAINGLKDTGIAALTNLQDQLTNAVDGAAGAAMTLLGKASQFASVFSGQVSGLVAGVQQAPGYLNTVDRSTIDAAVTRVIGSAKIESPVFELPSLASLGLEADIEQAQQILADAQNQVNGLINQAQGAVTQAQTTVNSLVTSTTNQAQNATRNLFG